MSSLDITEDKTNTLKKKHRLSRHCICLALFFPSFLLIVLLMVGSLVFTNTGLNLIVWAAEKALPQLSIKSTKGSLLPEFTLSEISYKNKELLDADISDFHLAITTKCLMKPSLCVDDITINGLTLDLPKLPQSTEEAVDTKATPNKLLSIPLPINVSNITLNNVNANILGNHLQWETFSTGVKLYKSDLTITPLKWKRVRVELAKSEIKESPKEKKVLSPTETAISLPDVYIPLNINVERFELSDFILEQETPVKINRLEFKGFAGESNVSISDFYLDMPQVNVSLKNDITLKGDYPLNLEATAELKETELKGHKAKLIATGSIADLDVDLTVLGGLRTTIDIDIHPLEKTLPFDLHVSKTNLYWPLSGEKEFKLSVPNIKAKGNIDKYQFSGALYIEGKTIPQTDVRLEGKGDLQEVNLSDFMIDTLGGTISGNAQANWASLANWKGKVYLQNIQPGLQWPEAEGNISGEIVTTGNLTKEGGWEVNAPLIDINGIFRKYPLNINGALNANDISGVGEPHIDISQLTLNHGDNGLSISGSLDKEWNLDVDIDFPELSDSVPDVQGKIIGSIELTGKLAEPRINLDIDALGLKLAKEGSLNKASIEGYIIPSPMIDADVSIKLLDGQYQKQILKDLVIRFSGKENNHKLQIDLDSNVIDSHLLFKGALNRKTGWQGELSEADVNTDIGPWKLDQKASLSYDIKKEEFFIQANCWSQGNTSLCLNKDLRAGKSGSADVSIKHFEFNKIKKFLPEETAITGEVNLDVLAKWSSGAKPYIKAALYLPEGNVQQDMEETLKVGWDKILINAEMQNDELSTDWLIALTDNGQLKGNLKIAHPTGSKELSGNSKIDQLSLKMLKPLLGEYSQLNAMINSDIRISGQAEHPKLLGDFKVENVEVKGEVSPVDINDGNININLAGHRGKLTSIITTSDGDLNIKGTGDWSDLANWKVGLDVYGKELQVNVPPMVKLKVKPDMKIRIIPTLAKITGSIGIPWGRVVVKELPESAIAVSKDEVILNDDLQPVEKSTALPMKVETDINISIGDDVLLSAFGLEGGLIGKLNITQKNKGPFITGEVNIKDGTYRSFGQDLEITKGKILFNGPADQPYVDIEAIRNPDNTRDDVIAGVRVNGPADTPKIEIFSSPSMPQANALSYLLRGQDIGSDTGGNAMTTTLIGLSLAKSGKVVGEIGQAFGVQDLQLDTAGSGEESQVTISGYIAPDLQVKYGVGIFNSLGEFTLRYRIISDLYIEAVSGVDSAVDLIYQFSFD
ncbi:autotransporter assembly complex protein TamB [Aliivibrio sifiae]|uniref:Translocation/assembly module TamB n=1 Tax=Aliivibrio sifiae TaxID=566293 RepID=A0A2S7X4S7_9GAMM|nr:translocation/assembly module TamB domain-containing protein [Aliivibrio sifiae]PQJ85247.1 hypothetical protein BTO23_18155 [Aliivibrio sifiae]GLR76568.1 translocation/assembly module TamB [Aliivibrio sifiae]